MEQVGVKELKAHASEILRRVEEGEEVEISRRGKVVARLVPTVQTSAEERAKRAEDLIALVKKIEKRVPPGTAPVDVTQDLRRDL
jgi:prevent-host-death family protein